MKKKLPYLWYVTQFHVIPLIQMCKKFCVIREILKIGYGIFSSLASFMYSGLSSALQDCHISVTNAVEILQLCTKPGIILYMCPANERRRYNVTSSHWLDAFTK